MAAAPECQAKLLAKLADIDAAEKVCGGRFTDQFKVARDKIQASALAVLPTPMMALRGSQTPAATASATASAQRSQPHPPAPVAINSHQPQASALTALPTPMMALHASQTPTPMSRQSPACARLGSSSSTTHRTGSPRVMRVLSATAVASSPCRRTRTAPPSPLSRAPSSGVSVVTCGRQMPAALSARAPSASPEHSPVFTMQAPQRAPSIERTWPISQRAPIIERRSSQNDSLSRSTPSIERPGGQNGVLSRSTPSIERTGSQNDCLSLSTPSIARPRVTGIVIPPQVPVCTMSRRSSGPYSVPTSGPFTARYTPPAMGRQATASTPPNIGAQRRVSSDSPMSQYRWPDGCFRAESLTNCSSSASSLRVRVPSESPMSRMRRVSESAQEQRLAKISSDVPAATEHRGNTEVIKCEAHQQGTVVWLPGTTRLKIASSALAAAEASHFARSANQNSLPTQYSEDGGPTYQIPEAKEALEAMPNSSTSVRQPLAKLTSERCDQHSLWSTALATLASSSHLSDNMSEPGDVEAAVACCRNLMDARSKISTGNSAGNVTPLPQVSAPSVGTPTEQSVTAEMLVVAWESLDSNYVANRGSSDILDRAASQGMGARKEDVQTTFQCLHEKHFAQASVLTPRGQVAAPSHAQAKTCSLLGSNLRCGSPSIVEPPYSPSNDSPCSEDATPAIGGEAMRAPDLDDARQAMFTHAIGKAVELLAEKKGLDYVAKTLVAELDVIGTAEARQDTRRPRTRHSAAAGSASQRQRTGSAGPRQRPALRLGHLRKPTLSSAPLANEIARKFKILSEPMTQKMDGRSFLKLCKDCRFFDRVFMAVDAELIFKKVLAGSGQRKIDLPKFEFALHLVAERKGMEPADMLMTLAESRCHSASSSVEAVRTEPVR